MEISPLVDCKPLSEITYINTEALGIDAAKQQRWKTIKLEEQKGDAAFNIGKICKDICLTRSRCVFNKDYKACIHYQEKTLLLVFGIKGYSSFGYTDSGRTYNVGPGDIWLVNTDKDKLFRKTPAGQENEMVVIKYSHRRLYDLFNDSTHVERLSKSCIIRLGHQESFDSSITKLVNNSLETATKRLMAESQALALLARWLEPADNVTRLSQPKTQVKLLNNEIKSLKKVVEILTGDLMNTPSLYELAEQANMSHTKLNRCFKKVYGQTVYSWLRLYRLESAKAYLAKNQDSIADIAFQCGFSSASHFAYSFKQQYHCSPAEYRQKAGLENAIVHEM